MLLAVVDTNVYVYALVFGGTPAIVLQIAATGAFGLVVSETIQEELEETLIRKFGWSASRFEDARTMLWLGARWVNPIRPARVSRDPDDDHVLACAVEARAQVILTGDRDLVSLHPYHGISILTPRQFLESRPWRDS